MCVGVSFFFCEQRFAPSHLINFCINRSVRFTSWLCHGHYMTRVCVCVRVFTLLSLCLSLSHCLHKFQLFFPPLGGALPIPLESPSPFASSPSLWMWLPALRLKRRMDQWWNNKRMDMIPRYPLFLQLWPFSPTGTSMCLISAVCLCSDLAGLHLHLVLKCISGILT